MAQDGEAPSVAAFLERFDHHSPDYPAVIDEAIRVMHARCPVIHTDAWGGYYVVSKFKDVLEAARHPEVFSSKDSISIPTALSELVNLIDMDPPRNVKYRALFDHLMTQAAVEGQRPWIRELAFSLMQAAAPSGLVDVGRDVAQPVAGITTFRILGLDESHWRTFSEPQHDFFYGGKPIEQAMQSVFALNEPLVAMIAEERKAPRSGTVLAALFEAELDGRKLDDREIGGLAFNIIGGGLDSTQAMIGNAVIWLGRHPEARRKLAADMDRIPAAVEEFLRIYAPFQGSARTVMQDYVLGGTPLKAGDRVLLHWGAASRDPQQQTCPYEVDLEGGRHGHAAFGLGSHLCVGAHLARAEAHAVIEAILTSAPEFEVDEEALRRSRDMGVVFGYDTVRIRF